MKKIMCLIMAIILFSGCGKMNNTPTRKVEALLSKYQSNDSEVIDDLDNVLMSDYNLTDDERDEYREFMSKHYQDMTYKIKDEKIDGDSATVDVEITVRDYSSALSEANDYRSDNFSEFDSSNTFASYRLDKLKDVDDTKTYTITFHLTKNGDEWVVDPLSNDDESKLNGTYGYNNTNTYKSSIENDNEDKSGNIDDQADIDDNKTEDSTYNTTEETRVTDNEGKE